ncbi:adenylate kinase 7 [Histomonas meleagridis]|nr:adenylate kinase 7 [Histomonas meleagridis]
MEKLVILTKIFLSYKKLILTVDLPSESTFLNDVEPDDLFCGDGIISCAAKVVDEFREKYNLTPLKVLVIGPPASGFVKVGQTIADHIGAPLIDTLGIVYDVQKEDSEFGHEIKSIVEENEGIISNEVICDVVHRRMAERDCRNHGWVICGFADNIEKAGELFDEGEEEQASPYFEHIPTHVIVLDARDKELEEIAAQTSDDYKSFQKELRRYRKDNDGDDNIIEFCYDRAIPSLICDALGETNDIIFDFIGPKRDFGRPQEEVDAEIAERERLKKVKENEQKQQRKEQLKEETEKWKQGDAIHQVCVSRLETVDSNFLSEKAKDLENYIEEEIMQHIIKGLIEVGKKMPDDPIDALAKFLFAEHRKVQNSNK